MNTPRRALFTAALALCAAPLAPAMQLEQTEQDAEAPPNPVALDQFGADVSMDAGWLLVGSPEAAASGQGRVFAYLDNGGGPVLQQELLTPGPNNSFGESVAVRGQWAAVADQASVYVFELAGGSWSFDQEIGPTTGLPVAYGASLAIDGDTIAVGQFGLADERVFVWVNNGGSWTIQQILTVNGGASGGGFGLSCALSGDTLVVGSRDDDQAALNAGAVYVFTRNGGSWTQQAKLVGTGAYTNRRLGSSVDLQPAGAGEFELAVGANAGNSNFGRAYVFRGADASWNQTANLSPLTGGAGSWFGKSVALDGVWLTVGSPQGDLGAPNSGLATMYRRCGARWVRQVDLTASDIGANDSFGRAVSAQDGVVVCGAPNHNGSVADEGAAYLYEAGDGGPRIYCFGDGSGTACPCGNEAAPGSETGCVNSSGLGGQLITDDSVSVTSDKLTAYGCGLLANQPGLLFAGVDALNGGAGFQFGDGLRCAGTSVVRLGTAIPDAGGDAQWGPGLQADGGWGAGDTRYFQAWYRNPTGGPCSSGFNLTNAVELTFEP